MKTECQNKKVESRTIQLTERAKPIPSEAYMVDNRNIEQMMTIDMIQRVEMEEGLLQGKFEPIQQKPNDTGLPDNIKSGVEDMSGFSMDDVRVHYNSDKPAHIQAHAYTQGADIHLAPGQEQHLPHEAWHVVQQKQGRVQPSVQLQGVNINNDTSLEREADEVGGIVLQRKISKAGAEIESKGVNI